MIRVLFGASDKMWAAYRAPLQSAFEAAGIAVDLARSHPPETVDYIVFAPDGTLTDFGRYTKARAVMSLWAGVETVVGNDSLTQPLTRMVDPGLTEGMVEYVTGHVLRHHLGMDLHILNRAGWAHEVPPLARDRRVGVLGLGALGAACAEVLAGLRFQVAGWSRTPRHVEGVACHHGDAGLEAVLRHADILILLLPLTRETEGLIDTAALNRMPEGAVLVNPGRGGLVNEADLLTALQVGRISHATLDTFRQEPLPEDHPFWGHPRITVTPHIASATRPASAAGVIAETVRRAESGDPLPHLVDRARGY